MSHFEKFENLFELKPEFTHDYQSNYKIYSQINFLSNFEIEKCNDLSIDDLIKEELNWKESLIYWSKNFKSSLLNILKNIHENEAYDFIFFTEEDNLFDFLNPSINLIRIDSFPYDHLATKLHQQILNSKNGPIIYLSHILKFSGICFKEIEFILKITSEKNGYVILDISDSFLFLKIKQFSNFKNIFFIYYDSLENFSFVLGPNHKGNNTELLKLKINTDNLYKYLIFLKLSSLEGKCLQSEIQKLQHEFIFVLNTIDHFYLCEKNIISCNYSEHGASFIFALPNKEVAEKMHNYLSQNGVFCKLLDSKIVFYFKLAQKNKLNFDFLKAHRKI